MISETRYKNQVTALDLGTTKFCLATIDWRKKITPHPVKTVSVDADGMRRGMLSDFSLARTALATLFNMAEKEGIFPPSQVAVGIAGSHLKSDHIHYKKSFSQRKINKALLRELCTEASSLQNAPDLVTLHTVPVLYRPGGREWIENPLDFQCNSIEVKFFRISADRHYVSDIITLCNQVGIEISSVYAEPWASAEVSLSHNQKSNGVILADIGGGTTDGIIFHEDRPVKLFTINIGGVLMTRDLSIGLRIPLQEAEQIKFKQGLINLKHQTSGRAITPDIVLRSRIRELANFLSQEIKLYPHPFQNEIVLTGGGSGVPGLIDEFKNILNSNIKIISPRLEKQASRISGLPEGEFLHLKYPKYATVSGMLVLEMKKILLSQEVKSYHYHSGKFFRYLCNWIRELS